MFTTISGMISFVLYAMLLVHGQFDPSFATKSDCYKDSADIVFVVDSSFSIREDDYDRQLTFLRALIDKFTIGQNNIQVGVVSFSSTIRLDIKLNDHDNSRDLKVAISKLEQLKTGTETMEAIRFVHTVMYEFVNGGRPWARKMMILITDGLSSDVSATLYEASVARSKGIEIFSVLVGRNDEFETWEIASEPKDQHMFKVENFRAFAGIESSLSSAACKSSDSGHDDTDKDSTSGSTHTASKECHKSVADVVFLMDSSNSIWEVHFREQIRFIQQVVSSFDINKDATRVAVIGYTDAPITLVGLTDKQTHANVNLALANAPYITGRTTNTASAIKEAKQILTNSNSRPNTAQVIIILSDGHSKNAKETIAEASHAHSENVYIFAIGIGNETDSSELMAVASDPDDKFVFRVDNYTALSEINELVAMKTCDVSSMMTQGDSGYASCPKLPTDVVFIYDKVALNIHHHDYVIRVITEFTDPHRLNSQELRVGVIREAGNEANSVVRDIALTHEWVQTDFKLQLDPDSVTSSIDVLLKRARLSYFSPSLQLSHRSHTKTIVLFLDSAISNSHAAAIEVRRLKKYQVKIVIITLGKNTDKLEAFDLATAPDDDYVINVPTVGDYPEYEVVSRLVRTLCLLIQHK